MESVIEINESGIAIVRFKGRLDLLSAANARAEMAKLVQDGRERLVVDLGEVSFIDSSGLGALISGLKAARQAGGDLRLARLGEQARMLFRLTNLDKVLNIYSSVEDALAGY